MESPVEENALITRLSMFAGNVLDTLVHEQKPATKFRSGQEQPASKRNRPQRKDFSYYMPLIDDRTKEIVGHLADISDRGFKLDSRKPIPANQDFHFRLNLPTEMADKSFLVFGARSRWCKVDPLDPCTYNVGYQLTEISLDDLEIFNRMMERYARYHEKKTIDLRRSNKW
jgi:hypothetical protein